MKNLKIALIATFITALLIVSCACAVPACAEGKNPNFGEFYPRLSIVVEVHEDVVICEDREGNLWAFYGDEWKVGDLCNLLMWNLDEDIEKHEVIEAYYEGTVDFLIW